MTELARSARIVKVLPNNLLHLELLNKLINKSTSFPHIWNGTYTHIQVLTGISGNLLDFRRIPLRGLHSDKSFQLKTGLRYRWDYCKISLICEKTGGIGKYITDDVTNKLLNGYVVKYKGNHSESPEFSKNDDKVVKEMYHSELTGPVKQIPSIEIRGSRSELDISSIMKPSSVRYAHICS